MTLEACLQHLPVAGISLCPRHKADNPVSDTCLPMYIKISGVNEMVSGHDLTRVFTFTGPVYKCFQHCPGVWIYFYKRLSDMLLAERLDGSELVDVLRVEFVPVVLERWHFSTPRRTAYCLCVVSHDEVAVEAVQRVFNTSVCCYLKQEKFGKILHVFEFSREVETKTCEGWDAVCALEDYVDHIIEQRAYGMEA